MELLRGRVRGAMSLPVEARPLHVPPLEELAKGLPYHHYRLLDWTAGLQCGCPTYKHGCC